MEETQVKNSASAHRRVLITVGNIIVFLVLAVVFIVQAIARWLVPSKYRHKKSLVGDVVLITGGGGGLGRLLALRLSRLGSILVLWDINMTGVEETIKMIRSAGGQAHGYRCDLADRQDVYRVAERTQREVGQVTILINNAGVASAKSLLETPDHLIQRTFEVNIMAHYWTTKAFLPSMIANDKGHIVTIASMAGYVGINKLVDYCGSKFAAVGFDESLRVELEAQGIRGVKTTVISPYFIQATGMFDNVNSFVPTLKGSDVADRIVKAIQENELFVLLPGYLRLMLMFKWIFPWNCVSLFLRGLVPDASPTGHKTIPEPLPKPKTDLISGSTTADVTLHHRITSPTERKP